MNRILPFLLLSAVPAMAAAMCTSLSSERRLPVLELYTSEGCDSCPPADRWISGLPARGLGTDRIVLLGFHVDYWDHLGWRDPYAQRAFSDRQRAINARNGARFVYTPQFILDGNDYRRAFIRDDLAGRVAAANRRAPGATIELRHETPANGQLAVEATITITEPATARAQALLVLYQNRLSSRVTAGENRGKRLNHDFVVRGLAGPYTGGAERKLQFRHTFSLGTDRKGSDLAVAAFVQDPRTGEVLQALAAPACN
jgi:hypothetical protein